MGHGSVVVGGAGAVGFFVCWFVIHNVNIIQPFDQEQHILPILLKMFHQTYFSVSSIWRFN